LKNGVGVAPFVIRPSPKRQQRATKEGRVQIPVFGPSNFDKSNGRIKPSAVSAAIKARKYLVIVAKKQTPVLANKTPTKKIPANKTKPKKY